MVEQGVKFSKQWFKKELSTDIIKEFYTPSVRFSKDAEGNVKPYPPTLKIQLKQRDGKFETAIYDEHKRPLTDVPLEEILVKGATISSLIQCTGVWFAGSKFGLSWKAIQMKADHLPESIRGFAFREEEDAHVAVAKPAVVPPPVVAQSTNTFATLADNDEVDDEVALAAPVPPNMDEDAELVEPVAVPKKPTLVTKKTIVKSVVKK